VEFRNSGRSPRIPETPDGLRTRLQNSGRAPKWSERLGVVGKNGNGLGVPLQHLATLVMIHCEWLYIISQKQGDKLVGWHN
jgi:hypothetical protein